MGPFAVFQALICVRDDGYTKKVSAAGAVAPLLFLLGWLLVCAVTFSLKYKTPYQVGRFS
jgi:hypothetical protein